MFAAGGESVIVMLANVLRAPPAHSTAHVCLLIPELRYQPMSLQVRGHENRNPAEGVCQTPLRITSSTAIAVNNNVT